MGVWGNSTLNDCSSFKILCLLNVVHGLWEVGRLIPLINFDN